MKLEKLVEKTYADDNINGRACCKQSHEEYIEPHIHADSGGCDKAEAGLAGCEFFFPLRDCPDHKGIYPVFGRVLEGMDEVYRLEKVETVPVTDFPIEGVEVNRPVRPEIIERVEMELYGAVYPEPVRVREPELPECWKDEAAE